MKLDLGDGGGTAWILVCIVCVPVHLSKAPVTTTIRLEFDEHSATVRQLIKKVIKFTVT